MHTSANLWGVHPLPPVMQYFTPAKVSAELHHSTWRAIKICLLSAFPDRAIDLTELEQGHVRSVAAMNGRKYPRKFTDSLFYPFTLLLNWPAVSSLCLQRKERKYLHADVRRTPWAVTAFGQKSIAVTSFEMLLFHHKFMADLKAALKCSC